MGKLKDAETEIATPSASVEAPPPATPAKNATPETQIALALIETLKTEAPKIEMPTSATPAIEIENPAPLAEMPKPLEMPNPIELSKPEPIASAPPLSPAAGTPNVASASSDRPRASRFALLAASVAAAAAIGALTGALAAAGITWSGSSPAPTPATSLAAMDLSALHDTITKMRSEIAALRAGVDTGAHNANAQFAKVTERFDRLDRAQADAAKLAKSHEAPERRADAPNDVTGSVSPSRPAPAMTPEQPASQRTAAVEGWVLRNVNRGVAYIQGRRMGVIEVERGDVVPGLGRIESIRRQDGHWVVVTARGLILPPR